MVAAIAPTHQTPRAVRHGYSFEALCVPMRESLYSKALQLTRSHAAAQDLVQETMVHALVAWDSFLVLEGEDPIDRARGWLHRILKNQFITDLRASNLREDRLEVCREDVIERTLGHGPADPAEFAMSPISEACERALLDLDKPSRDVIIRVDLRGESYKEICDELGISIGTVKSRLHRARRRLADELSKQGLPPPARLERRG